MSFAERRTEVLGSRWTGRWVSAPLSRTTGDDDDGYEGKRVVLTIHLLIKVIVNPLFAFSFLESFLETLQDYLGDVTETALKDNFDIVYMVSCYVPISLAEDHQLTGIAS